LKNPKPTPLLPAALQGLSKFAHLINIDFFQDLMQVLKDLISHESEDGENSPSHFGDPERSKVEHTGQAQHQLLCIITAFDLLSGQGMSNFDVP